MSEANSAGQINLAEMTVDIVSAYVSNNSVPAQELPDLLTSVHATLRRVSGGVGVSQDSGIEKTTVAQIKKSITRDAIISFEDGKSYKTLKRHLRLRGLSPDDYRAKYGLPADYPMVSPAYSAQRSELARSLGLGKLRNVVAKDAESDGNASGQTDEAPPKRIGRPRKAAAAAE